MAIGRIPNNFLTRAFGSAGTSELEPHQYDDGGDAGWSAEDRQRELERRQAEFADPDYTHAPRLQILYGDGIHDDTEALQTRPAVATIPSNQFRATDIPIIETSLGEGQWGTLDLGTIENIVGSPPSQHLTDEMHPTYRPRIVRNALQSLQVALHIPADGIYGPITEEALREWRGSQMARLRINSNASLDPTTPRFIGTDDDIEAQCGIMVTNLRGEKVGYITQINRHYDAESGYNNYSIEVMVPHQSMVEDYYTINPPTEPVIEPPENRSSLQRRELP